MAAVKTKAPTTKTPKQTAAHKAAAPKRPRPSGVAPQMNPNMRLITGVVCGMRVEDITDPLMQKIRHLDKLIDELARGKKMTSILRQ